MKKGVFKKERILISFIILFTLTASISASDVAYIYKSKVNIDDNVIKAFEDLGLTVELIDEKNLPNDFSKYNLIFVGDERFSNQKKIPVGDFPTIISNYFFGEEWGLTDSDGVSKLAATSPLNVRKGNQIIEVYTKARYNGVSIPYYYLANENKASNMLQIASTYTGNSLSLGDVISYASAGTTMINNKNTKENLCFFGIIESDYWTDKAKEMFKECVAFVGIGCKNDNDCSDVKKGTPYCKEDGIYQDVEDFKCQNPGTFKSQCVDDLTSQLVKSCPGSCSDGRCLCNDKDNDGFDECNIKDEGDDGKKIDCNDNDNKVYPGAPDALCNGVDNDCDSKIDDDYIETTTVCGIGECSNTGLLKCINGNEVNSCISKTPASEICDNKDNDCDLEIDENNNLCSDGKICSQGQCVPIACNQDSDCGKDGYVGSKMCFNGDVQQEYIDYSCINPGTKNSYCDSDTTKKLIEECSNNEICSNGQCLTKCIDNDKDGYDNCNVGYPSDDGKKIDCNDNDKNINPGATEVCDGKDNDCDGKIDEADGDLCDAGNVCVLGICQNVKCNKDLDCGADGFIDGLFCQKEGVYQNYIDWTCENPGTISSSCSKKVESKLVTQCSNGCSNGMCVDVVCNKDSDCNDSDNYTKDSCINPGTVDSYCSYENIECKTNNDCDDNNDKTSDTCINPGTTQSFCSHGDIICSQNSDCGTDGFVDKLYCDGVGNNDVYQNFKSWKCENPGTISSSCTQKIESKLVSDCEDKCIDGSCISIVCENDSECNDNKTETIDKCENPGTLNSFCTHDKIQCFKDNDCGTNRFTGELFCQDDNINRNFIKYKCNNAGTVSSYCSNSVEEKFVKECLYSCSAGTCVRCNDNNDCDDGKSNTVDTCRFAGTIDSYCRYETVQCESKSDCGTDGYVGNTFCKGNDIYQGYRTWMCKNPNSVGSFCNFDENDVLVKECQYGCSNGKCKSQTQCSDGKDNDNDGLTDGEDPGCWNDLGNPDTYNPNLDDESRGGIQCKKNSDCGTDGYVGDKFCKLESVYQKFKSFRCNNPGTGISSCSSEQKDKLITECSQNEICNNGICIGFHAICDDDSDCGQDKFIGDKFCRNNDVYQNYKVFSCVNPGSSSSSCNTQVDPILVDDCSNDEICSNGACVKIACNKNSDCGTDGYVGSKMCFNGDVQQEYIDYSCINPGTKNSYCDSDTTKKLIEECSIEETCSNGMCVEVDIICKKNSDCGTDGYVGDKFCKYDDVYQKYNRYNCLNPGSRYSSCNSDTEDKLVQDCINGCSNGKCKDAVSSIQIISPINNSIVNNDDILIKFKTTNWVVGGKGENHVHFHIDNVNGLNFSDHLMFYNGLDEIIELNFIPGQTKFATWISEDTIRINDVPDGMHKIRAHLATESHLPPGNPEAIYEIIIHVHAAKQCVDKDGDGYGDNCDKGPDCNDNDKNINPGATEVCDGKDNDCDGKIDEADGDLCDAGSSCFFGTCQKINCKKNSECGTDGFIGENFCKNDDIYGQYKKFTCNNPGTIFSYCNSDTEIKLRQQCTFGCSSGQCTGECKTDADCPNDFYSENYCSQDNVVRDLHDFSCISSTCKETITKKTIEMCSDICVNGFCADVACYGNSDCGNDGFIGNKFCKNNDVYQKYEKNSCLNPGTLLSSCLAKTEDILFDDCSNDETCSNGACVKIACNKDSDCGKDGYVGDKFCKGNDVHQNFKEFTCNNPATSSSSCNSDVNSKLVQKCNFGCSNGKCITEICNDGIDNDGDGKIDGLKELDPNNKETLRVTNPFKITGSAIINNSNKKFGFSLFSKDGTAVLRSLNGNINSKTLSKLCEVFGYKKVKSHACVSPDYENRCNFQSPHDNELWIYDTNSNNFKLISAKNVDSLGEREWLSDITCETRLPACSDGWDNDGDGKIDRKDPGCANEKDDDEREHDEDCV